MKKRIVSAVMALILCLTLLPATVLADDTGTASSVAEVSTMEDLNAALSNESVAEIHIIADMTYNDPLVASKPVRVNEGVTLTLSAYQCDGVRYNREQRYNSGKQVDGSASGQATTSGSW